MVGYMLLVIDYQLRVTVIDPNYPKPPFVNFGSRFLSLQVEVSEVRLHIWSIG